MALDFKLDCLHSLHGRWITLIVSFLGMAVFGTDHSYTAYTQDLKQLYNLTQRQYGIFATVYVLGCFSMILTGPVLDRCGASVVYCLSLVLSVSGHAVLWQLTMHHDFEAFLYILYGAAYIAGLGLSGMYVAPMSVNMANFSASAHGTISASVNGIALIGTLIFTLLYREIFSPNIGGYFLMVTILCAFVNTAAILLVRKTDSNSQRYQQMVTMDLHEDSASVQQGCEYSGLLNNESQEENNKSTCLSYKVQILFWIFVSSACVMHVLMVSFSTYSDSLGFADDTTWVISMIPALSVIIGFLGGMISDYYLDKVPRMAITLIINICVLGELFLSIFYINKLWVLILLALSTSMTMLSVSALIPSELHKQVGDKHYGTLFGVFYFAQAILTVGLQYVTSLFYDLELRAQKMQGVTGAMCQGKACFTQGFILLSVVYALCVTLNILYVCKKYYKDIGS